MIMITFLGAGEPDKRVCLASGVLLSGVRLSGVNRSEPLPSSTSGVLALDRRLLCTLVFRLFISFVRVLVRIPVSSSTFLISQVTNYYESYRNALIRKNLTFLICC